MSDQWIMPPTEIFGIDVSKVTPRVLAWHNDSDPANRRAFIQAGERILFEGTPSDLRAYFEACLEQTLEVQEICDLVPPAQRTVAVDRGLER